MTKAARPVFSEKPSRCHLPNHAVRRPASRNACAIVGISGGIRTSWPFTQSCGYRPVSSVPRAGQHSGNTHWWFVKRMPSAASRSRSGVTAFGLPAQESIEAGCWSERIQTALRAVAEVAVGTTRE